MIPANHLQRRRAPTRAELGLDVTIGIVAIAGNSVVAVSDQRFSYYDVFPPTERGANKIIQITADASWFIAFAATDISLFVPLIRKIRGDLVATPHETRTLDDVQRVTADAYADVRIQQFVAQHLTAIGYRDFQVFQKEGYHDLGKDEHARHMEALYKFDLGVEIIVFGYTDKNSPRLFKVCNPGRAIECAWEGYAAVGSGTYLALGALRQKAIPYTLVGTIYRVLEAKFVAEAASHVGKSTNVLVLHPNGTSAEMTEAEIGKVRAIWQKMQAKLIPHEAIAALEACEVVKLAALES